MFYPLSHCFENLKMIATQDYRLLLLLVVFGSWQKATDEQKQTRINRLASPVIEKYDKCDPHHWKEIVTDDKTLIYHFEPKSMPKNKFQQSRGEDVRKTENHESKAIGAKLKILLYCEKKPSVNQLPHFHKKKCITRNGDLYTKYCASPSTKKDKYCQRFIKKLEKGIKGNPGPELRILSRKKNDMRLCGNRKARRPQKLYNTSEYICCMGETYIRWNKDRELACCGKTVVDTSEEICCDRQNYVRASVEETCCGKQVYNTSTHFCHHNHIYGLSEDSNVTSPLGHNDSSEQEFNITDPSTNYEAKSWDDDQTSKDEPSNDKTLSSPVLVVILCFGLIFVGGLSGYVIFQYKRSLTSKRNTDTSSGGGLMLSSLNIQDKIFCTNSTLVNSGQISNQSFPGQNNVKTDSSPETNEADDQSLTVAGHSDRTANKENNRIRRRSGESLHSHVSLKLEDFIKDSKVRRENFAKNLIKDSSTQTCPPKETNRRDVFGKVFQYSGFLTKKNPSIKLKNSDAKMTLSSKDLSEHDIEVNVSSHTGIQEIKQKMGIRDDCHIASPCMEYDLPGIDKLEDFAVIEMKLVQRENDQVQVWRMTTGEDGAQTFEVPVVQSIQPHLDTFCLVENGKGFIYTKIFSVYVCTKHNVEEEIDLWGVLYAKMTCSPIRAVLTLYVVERLHVEVNDYKAKLDMEEGLYGMRRIDVNRVPLPDKVTSRDQLIVRLSIDDRERWDFIRDRHNPDEEYDAQILYLCDICCHRRSVETSRCKWQMENVNGPEPDIFRGHFYVRTMSEEREKRVFTVDESLKRDQDKYLSNDYVRPEMSKSLLCSVDQRPVLHNELSYSDE